MTGPIDRAGRLVRTASHLRARQLAHLGLRRLFGGTTPPLQGPAWDTARGTRAVGALAALGPVARESEARHHAAGWCAGVIHGLGVEVPWHGDWAMRGPSPLWRYHLQYHDHLADLAWVAGTDGDARALAALAEGLDTWARAWAGGGAPAWDAYPVSVRLVNWLRILGWAGDRLGPGAVEALRTGVARHAALLAKNLEWHLDANHLLRDAWALGVANCVLATPVGPRDLFARIMAEQVRGDGWHEERSPMYHARALRDARELEACADASGVTLDAETRTRIGTMHAALPWMLRGDGSLWTLNDAAQDLGVDLVRLSAGAPAPAGIRHFDDAAISVLVDTVTGDRLRIDRGAPAPTHQPAHAHAGALAFEWDVAGIPCIVDRGCSGYDGDPWRAYLRGTSAHNTVTIDDTDQSELWATFRVGGRAKVRTLDRSGGTDDFSLDAECRGWSTPDARHGRRFVRTGRTLRIEDRMDDANGRAVAGYLHLDPAWEVERIDDRTLRLTHARAQVRCSVDGDVSLSVHRGERAPLSGWHARGFGDVVPAWTMRFTSKPATRAVSWRTLLEPA